ncbi:type I pantothenate kinase [Bacillus massiliglaciei]|uniref:type I pantothenate kinase n=1 Tax=Bacillus massiliglaciei TaxID=1816693 RepID=UPI000DA5FBA8|nr:type I pantothenate kinase [Bacillus massiliglaciei]
MKTLSMEYSPYSTFSKEEWAKLRFNTPMTLSKEEVKELQGINENLSIEEVTNIYIPLTRLLNLYATASQQLHGATDTFFRRNTRKVPYIIGVAGSVAVGKSTTSRVIKALLSKWPNHPKVEIVTTDGFLFPNAVLEARGLMKKKGFPESYDTRELISFLAKIKSGMPNVEAPVYSHQFYDIIPGKYDRIDQPDIVIVEGINVLQTPSLKDDQTLPTVFVSDFFDFSIYVDAEKDDLVDWYVARFKKLRDTAFHDPTSYFHKYATLSDEETEEIALGLWNQINKVNLIHNIEPTKTRADLILEKGANHAVSTIKLRKI